MKLKKNILLTLIFMLTTSSISFSQYDEYETRGKNDTAKYDEYSEYKESQKNTRPEEKEKDVIYYDKNREAYEKEMEKRRERGRKNEKKRDSRTEKALKRTANRVIYILGMSLLIKALQ